MYCHDSVWTPKPAYPRPRGSVIAENVVAFELARLFLEKFGGDSLREIERNYQGYLEQVKGSLP